MLGIQCSASLMTPCKSTVPLIKCYMFECFVIIKNLNGVIFTITSLVCVTHVTCCYTHYMLLVTHVTCCLLHTLHAACYTRYMLLVTHVTCCLLHTLHAACYTRHMLLVTHVTCLLHTLHAACYTRYVPISLHALYLQGKAKQAEVVILQKRRVAIEKELVEMKRK